MIDKAQFGVYAENDDGLFELERRMKAHARRHRHDEDYCANRVWYGRYKPEMVELAGWSAASPTLKSSAAYDDIYDYLYHLLPDCNHDGVCRG